MEDVTGLSGQPTLIDREMKPKPRTALVSLKDELHGLDLLNPWVPSC